MLASLVTEPGLTGLGGGGYMLVAQPGGAATLLDFFVEAPECAAIYAPEGRLLEAGETIRQPELGDILERLGREGAEPFYCGDIAAAVVDWLGPRGAMLTARDLAEYRAIPREPLRAPYRDREVLTNPPPSAGGILIAHALDLLEATRGSP